jgi:hypothetical protein
MITMRKVLSQVSCLALVFVLFLSILQSNVYAQEYSWAGEWNSNWGKMVFTQSGNVVTGTYTHDSGKLTGTISGNKLIGTWSEAGTYAPPNDAGDVELTMSEDGKSFTGKWRYGSTGNYNSSSWTGTRTTAVPATTTTTPVTSSTLPNDNQALTTVTGAFLNDIINFKLDNQTVIPVGDDGTPVLPISFNGTTYLPVRAIGYLLGLGIEYDGPTKTVLIASNTTKVAPVARAVNKTNKLIPITGTLLNGEIKFKLDGAAVIPVGDDGTPVLPISYNGTTYLPVRAIGYLLELGITYDNPTKTVFITRSGGTPSGISEYGWNLVGSELVWPSSWQNGSLTLVTSGQYLATNDIGSNSTTLKSVAEGNFIINNVSSINGNVFDTTEYAFKWTAPSAFLKGEEMIGIPSTIQKVKGDGFGISISANIDYSSFNGFSTSGEWNKRTYVEPNNTMVLLKCKAPKEGYDNINTDTGKMFQIIYGLNNGRGNFSWIYTYEWGLKK